MNTSLGQLVRVDPRTVWKHEAHGFTPWLVENIDRLSEALGMELEVVEREADVGNFSVDIQARDLGSNRVVVIENQLEATDHSHLGQLVTYAAGLQAGIVIWVSRDFRDEHRQALDWLNAGDAAGAEYFGVALEVVQIDDSKPAVNLRVVASPNHWARASRRDAPDGQVSEKGAAYLDYFQQLIDELREVHRFTNAKAGQPQNWYSFSAGTRGFTYSTSFAHDGRIRAELRIDFGDRAANEAVFDELAVQRATIEQEFGEPLIWERLDNRRACRVATYTPGSIEDPVDHWEQHRRWAIDRLLRFKRVFGPRLQNLKELDLAGRT